MRRTISLIALLGAAAAWAVPPANREGDGPVPPEAIAPLLYIRMQGPQGLRCTFYEGGAPKTFAAPIRVGLRPGWAHWVRLDGLPGQPPDVALYPSLEVVGTLRLPPRVKAADHPVPVSFTEDDIAQALKGVMVTKVFVLEDPDEARPETPDPGQIFEFDLDANENIYKYALKAGRPVLVVRLGRRERDPQELRQQGRGMVLYPGEMMLPPARPGPCILPVSPFERAQEILRDGGDRAAPIHLGRDGSLGGLDPSDTAAQYRDFQGRPRVVISNVVCLCVPRFLGLRQLSPTIVQTSVREPIGVTGLAERELLQARQRQHDKRQIDEMISLRARTAMQQDISTQPTRGIIGVHELAMIRIEQGLARYLATEGLKQLTREQKAGLMRQVELALLFSDRQAAAVTRNHVGTVVVIGTAPSLGQVKGTLETREVVYFCEEEKPTVPEKPLQILKWADRHSAQIGDVVTFTIRYSNLGGRPISNIAVSDSLTARLEYLPGTAKSDREAVFVMQDNEAGSLILRWEVKDPLPPGQHGIVQFQARVR